MPAFLMPLLRLFGPMLVSAAVNYLEKKYPGMKEVLNQILDYIKQEANKEVAVKNVRESLHTTAVLPSLKQNS